MITKRDLQDIKKLQKNSAQHQRARFVIEGGKLISEAVQSGYSIELLISTPAYAEKNFQRLHDFQKGAKRFETITQKDFDAVTALDSPSGILAVISKLLDVPVSFETLECIVWLDGVQDPGNVGTIIRTCDWFGIPAVFCGAGSADPFSPKVLRASMGSVFHVPSIQIPNAQYRLSSEEDFLKFLHENGFTVVSADLGGIDLSQRSDDGSQIQYPGKVVLVFSNEGSGPSAVIKKYRDSVITIPAFGKAESLNVASAAAIIIGSYRMSRGKTCR